MIIMQLPWYDLLLAVLVTLLAAGRITRLVTYDDYPPTIAIRIWWGNVTRGNGWEKLVNCYWCFGPWATLAVGGTFFLTFLATWIAWVWWLLFSWLALSYLTSMIVDRDESGD